MANADVSTCLGDKLGTKKGTEQSQGSGGVQPSHSEALCSSHCSESRGVRPRRSQCWPWSVAWARGSEGCLSLVSAR